MVMMKRNLLKAIILCIVGLSLLLPGIIPIVQSDDLTSIVIQPSSTQVGMSQKFTLGVYCTPAESMKSFECRFSFDPSLLSVIDVREGDMFDGFETFFNKGTIDNGNGGVTMIYGLILGIGNVSDPGNLVYVDFEALQDLGVTSVTLSNVGVTNEVEYLPITVSHGSVEVLAMLPTIEEVTISFSDPLDTDPSYGWYKVQGLINDDDIDTAFLVVTRPDGMVSNLSMNQLTSTTFSLNIPSYGHGTYRYHLFVMDAQGYHVSSGEYTFVIPPNWDVNNDGYASVLDFIHISNKMGQMGPAGWVRADVNNNGLVSLADLMRVSPYYHQYW